MPDRVVEVGGVALAVQERGSGDPPLVLLHGYTGSMLDWADVIDDLAESRRVVAYDHRGHGASANPGNPDAYSLDSLESDFHQLLDALGVGAIDLLGHSMGGMVALRAVLARPERVRSLVLMDTSADPVAAMPKPLTRALAKIGREEGMPSLYERIGHFFESAGGAREHLAEKTRAVLVSRNRAKFEQLDVEAFETLAAVLSDFAPMSPRLGEISCPTTVIVGENDTGTEQATRGFRASAEVLADGIEGASLHVIPVAGHCPQEENRGAWLAAVREHLGRVDQRAGVGTGGSP